MKYCANCGQPVDETKAFCSNCGAPIRKEEPAQPQYQYQSAPQQVPYPVQPAAEMGFFDAVKSVFSNYANFSGRARRREYWYFTLFTGIVSLICTALSGILDTPIFTYIYSLYGLATLIPSFAVIWRRLHDIGRSGGSYFLVLIPLIGWIIVLVRTCKDSQPGPNKYGLNPKGIGNVQGYTYYQPQNGNTTQYMN